jgi:cytochrome c nitrite reductase small subunit
MQFKKFITASLLILPGIFIGVSAYTVYYAKGYSYLIDDPKVCTNCHVMRDNYTAWGVSPHRFVTCNGCHVPHNYLTKYLVKGENGFRHSYVFTFGNPQVFRLKTLGQSVVEANCVRCHGMTVSCINYSTSDGGKRCFDCHVGLGHKF